MQKITQEFYEFPEGGQGGGRWEGELDGWVATPAMP